MPTYGYRCDRCEHELEIFQRMSDEPLKVCPECGGELRRLLYPVGVQFKGSGFYTTDYRNGGSRPSQDGHGERTGDKSEKAEKAEAKAETAATKED